MEKSVSSLLGVLKRRSLPAVAAFVATIGGAIAYLAVTPSQYEASARLMLDTTQTSISELGRNISQVSSNTPGGPSPLADTAELVKSQRVLNRAVQIFQNNHKSTTQVTTQDLSKGLGVKIVPATNILQLSYEGKDPILAAQLLNAVARAMEEESANTIRQEAANVRKFLETEVPKARKQLENAELKENKYRQSSGIISFTKQSESLVDSLATLENQERTLSAQLRELRSQDASLRQITNATAPESAYASVRGGQDEQLKELRTKLTELETKLAEVRAKYTESHPDVQALLSQRDSVRNLYLQGLNRVSSGNQPVAPNNVRADEVSQNLSAQLIANNIERTAVENKLKSVQAQRGNLQLRLAQLPIKQQQLTPLTRQREEAAETVKLLQSKYEEARIAEAQQVGNIRIIEEALPPTAPASPRRSVVLVLATALSTLLATSIVLLLEMMDNTLRDASEAEDLLKLSLLGVLPRLPSKTLVLEPARRFLDNVSLVEPYRMLFKTLEFRSEQMRVIVVSSSIAGEGKSIVASHLAAIAGMLSWRTLLIDADLRRPEQHTLFNLSGKPGMSDVLEGEISLADAVQSTDIENLDVLTCGELHGRPSQLLESVAMKSLVAEAAENYDLVIIDTPPLSACADAATLAKQSDGVMLVTRPGFTLKEILSRSVSELNRNRIPILGVVVNGMTSQTEKYYQYSVNGYLPRKQLTTSGRRDILNSSRSK
ncbi:polysaccharide biosynthesis tyrosine autokinase [Scytonema sp. UIC 10036]|uniref:GumC family protein n=1 Tax=Scytonema sp. UIC 10036 TaxID=2304196 RepID=UPI0012DA83D8|nr:polysaccharide biosynthesis tyrosine autokinase [Scytonema sp. UIC 10036]MUH01766.1 polysaccharide biosynthesis tyrosine autokinase [Scytonema sp. UIC 10036]